MRRLRVAVSAVGSSLPVIVGVVVLPAAEACGTATPAKTYPAPGSTDAQADVGAADTWVGFGQPDAGIEDAIAVDTSAGGLCGPAQSPMTYIVSVPPPGVPADPGQICAVRLPPVTSNEAARITLTSYSPGSKTAFGSVSVPAGLASEIVGVPAIRVVSAPSGFETLAVSNLRSTPGGFTFEASWPGAAYAPLEGARMTLMATFTLACADGGTQTVESSTELDLCLDGTTLEWVSSGDACTVCEVIAEMAPSPIVPNTHGDDLPLGRVLRLRVVELARAGRTVVLLAENDGGEGTDYSWQVSGGRVEHLAPDIVLWTVPSNDGVGDGVPSGQVAVWNEAGAAVESFVWSRQ
jgi:hypothetical protein